MNEDIKFRRIEKLLREEFMGPACQVSDRLESENALMARFNVSKVTVRAALKRLEDAGIILCEHGKRRVLLRKPDDTRKLRSGMTFGIFMRSEFLTESTDLLAVSRGLAEELRRWNADLTILPMSGEISELQFVKRVVGRNLIDGLFITRMAEGTTIVDYLTSLEFPCVAFSYMEDAPTYHARVPFVELKEAAPLNTFAARFRRILVAAQPGPSLERTRHLLDRHLPIEILTLPPATREQQLQLILTALADDELLLVASLDILPTLDIVAHRTPARDFRPNVLVFKHCPTDLSPYQGRYLLFDRPVETLGIEAAKIMRELILNKRASDQPSDPKTIPVHAAIRDI